MERSVPPGAVELSLALPDESGGNASPAAAGQRVVQVVKERVVLGLDAVKDFMGINLLTSLLLG